MRLEIKGREAPHRAKTQGQPFRHPGWSDEGNLLANMVLSKRRQQFAGKSAAKRYKLARKLIDEAFERYRTAPDTPPIGCRSERCFGCCLHQKEVDTSVFEVRRILGRVQKEGRLQEVVSRAQGLAAKRTGGACPLLGRDGKCTVYDIRPLSCAAYHSLDREACHSGATAEIRSAEMLWIEAMLIAGLGMVPEEEMTGGAPVTKTYLFQELAKQGRAMLPGRSQAA